MHGHGWRMGDGGGDCCCCSLAVQVSSLLSLKDSDFLVLVLVCGNTLLKTGLLCCGAVYLDNLGTLVDYHHRDHRDYGGPQPFWL